MELTFGICSTLVTRMGTREIISFEACSKTSPDLYDFFKKGCLIDSLDWGKVFSTPMDHLRHYQFCLTHAGQEILIVIQPNTETSENASFVIYTFLELESFRKMRNVSAQTLEWKQEGMLVVESEKMKNIFAIIEKITFVDSTVLLLGESGVGKSGIAKWIHKTSNRSQKPFVSINCGSLPESLIESELFGYEHGSFTGGKKGGKPGLFEVADEGTIFLDEIAELPLALQVKLLEVLQESHIRRIGGIEPKKINVRVIAATNKNLLELINKKLFREDLYYRLNVVPITLPPLRERQEDIPKLIEYFLEKFNNKYGLNRQLSKHIKEEFYHYSWPGNIRELENSIERILVTNSEEVFISLPSKMQSDEQDIAININGLYPLKAAKKILEKQLVTKAYALYGSTYKAARALQVDQSTIAKKLKEYQIDAEEKFM